MNGIWDGLGMCFKDEKHLVCEDLMGCEDNVRMHLVWGCLRACVRRDA